MSMLEMYLITRCDAIHTLFVMGVSASFAVMFGCCMIGGFDFPKIRNMSIKFLKYSSISAVIFSVLTALTPTTKEFVAIYVIPKVINNEQVQQIPENMIKIMNSKLESWINDLADNTNPSK